MDPTAGIRGALDTYTFLAKKVLRHWVWFVVGFALTFGAAAAYTFTRGDLYKSETLVQIDRSLLIDPIENGGGGVGDEPDLKTRINQLTASRTRLAQVVTELNLYAGMRSKGKSMNEIVAVMRDELVVELRGEDAFMLAFQNDDPRTAQAVVQRTAELFIRDRQNARTDRARTTARLVGEELQTTLRLLGEQEDQLSEFKEDHPTELLAIERRRMGLAPVPAGRVAPSREPHRPAGPRVVLVGEGAQQLQEARARKSQLEAELRTLQPAPVSPNSPEADDIRAQIQQLQQERAALRARFTDDYPDVVLNAQRIAGLQRRLQQTMRPAQQAAGAASSRQLALTQEIGDLDIEIARIQRGATRVVRPAPGQANEPARQAPVPLPRAPAVPMTLPEIEAQMGQFTAGVETLRDRYQAALKRKYDVDFALSVEEQQAAESVRVIDAADLPNRPFYPNRPKLLGAGAAAGFALGLALAFLFAVLDTRIFTEGDLARSVDIPVLVSIPDYRKQA
ncbi:MAG: hypothetical protein HYY06_19545 [Deltaproteobacteria bacterium]|nr:hypothetical protein [Deltaproteobacteria bacterium]